MLTDPARRACGDINSCHPERGAGVVAGRMVLLPDDCVLIRGWAFEDGSGPVSAFAAVETLEIPLTCGIRRLDVVAAQGLDAVNCGLEGRVSGLDAIGQPFELQVHACFAKGQERRVGAPFRFIPTARGREATPPLVGAGCRGRIRRVADTRPEPFPPGWSGRRSIRPDAAIEISGWALDPNGNAPAEIAVEVSAQSYRVAFPTQMFVDGEAALLAGSAASFAAGFRCIVDPEPLVPGLYDVTVIVRASNGAWYRGPSSTFQIAPRIAEIAPIFLPVAREPAASAVERLDPTEPLQREPIAIAGWAIDPASNRGGPVFVAFDDEHPLPIPSQLPRPDVRGNESDAIGFAGIADTSDLAPGPHRLRVLLLATSGALWHMIAERRVNVR